MMIMLLLRKCDNMLNVLLFSWLQLTQMFVQHASNAILKTRLLRHESQCWTAL